MPEMTPERLRAGGRAIMESAREVLQIADGMGLSIGASPSEHTGASASVLVLALALHLARESANDEFMEGGIKIAHEQLAELAPFFRETKAWLTNGLI